METATPQASEPMTPKLEVRLAGIEIVVHITVESVYPDGRRYIRDRDKTIQPAPLQVRAEDWDTSVPQNLKLFYVGVDQQGQQVEVDATVPELLAHIEQQMNEQPQPEDDGKTTRQQRRAATRRAKG